MSFLPVMSHSSRLRFPTLAAANAGSVAALYWNQALIQEIANTFPDSHLLSLIPSMTLAGYAMGVTLIAFGPVVRWRVSIERHLTFLAISLLIAGSAPDIPTLIIASFFVGWGAAVAQRLLASAAGLVSPASIGTAISQVVCGALLAILCTRLFGDKVAHVFGWRPVLFMASFLIGCLCLIVFATRSPQDAQSSAIATPGAVRYLWKTSPVLRRAVFQQAALFAAFNASWMTVMVQLPLRERSVVVIGGSCAGIIAALAAGRFADKPCQNSLPRAGAAAVLVAGSLLLPAAYCRDQGVLRTLLTIGGMALVDAGLQVSLIGNQKTVQALEPLARARLAATVTVSGALGAAFGAGVSYWLWQLFGWPAAIGLVGAAGSLGLSCSLWRPNYSVKVAVEPIPDKCPWRNLDLGSSEHVTL